MNLWLTNDEFTYNAILHIVKTNAEQYNAAEDIKNYVADFNPLTGTATLFTDLLNAALSEVNWCEIAKSFRETNKEEEKYEGAQ